VGGAGGYAEARGDLREGVVPPEVGQSKLAWMAMSFRFAQQLKTTPVTLNVAYPGHAYTSMNKNLTTSTYPPLARPIVPLLRLAMPVVYGHRALLKATRSSVYLASSPDVQEIHGTYFNSKATPSRGPTQSWTKPLATPSGNRARHTAIV
jgi:NAD(P)-dependent dehydrogenase (short-subunit alcohol dehydrogenase family)